MNEIELGRRIGKLLMVDDAAEDRTARALRNSVAAAAGTRRKRNAVASITAALVSIVLVLTPVGSAVGDAADQLLRGFPDQEAALKFESQQQQLELFQELLRGVLVKAAWGDLNADLPPQYVIEVVSGMLDPPGSRGEAGDNLEEQAIELTEKLRAAGDLPPIGTQLTPELVESW